MANWNDREDKGLAINNKREIIDPLEMARTEKQISKGSGIVWEGFAEHF